MPVESCIPIIPRANLEKSLRLWVDGLGFSMSSEMHKDDKLIFCMLRKDDLCLMLNQRAGTPVSGTDPSGAVSRLRFDQTTFDGHTYFILETRPTQTKYLQCDTRVRTEWSFRMRPDH
jgi:hypothetical protein